MPTVPVYDEQRVPVAPLPALRAPVEAPVEAFGGGPTRAAAIEAAAGIFADAKQRADYLAVLDAETRLTTWSTAAMYDPKTGAVNKTGRAAFDVHGEVLDSYAKQVQEIEKGLRGGDQVRAFRATAEQRRLALDSQLMRHVSVETGRYEDDVTDASLEAQREEAEADPLNLPLVAGAIQKQVATLTEFAARTGKSDEWLAGKVSEAISDTNSRVVSRLLSAGLNVEAREYFKDHRHEFRGRDVEAIEKAVREGGMRADSQAQADKIRGESPTLEERVATVRKIEDDDLRDETMKRVMADYNLDRTARTETANGLFLSAHKAVLEAPVMMNDPMDAVDPVALAAMDAVDPSYRQNLEKLAAERNRTFPIITDDRFLIELDLLKDEDLAKLSGDDMLIRYRPNLAKADWDKARTRWSAAREEAEGRGGKDVAPVSVIDRYVDETLKAAGVDTTPRSTAAGIADAARQARYRLAVDDAVRVLELKDPAKVRELTAVMWKDQLLTVGRERIPYAAATEEQRAAGLIAFADIPQWARNDMTKAFEGWRLTPDEIALAYTMTTRGRGRAAIGKAIEDARIDKMVTERERRIGVPISPATYFEERPFLNVVP